MSESFSELFENSEIQQNVKPGALLMGTVVSMNREKAIINVGLKSEGFISLNEFKDVKGELEITEGDVVEVALESIHSFHERKLSALRCGKSLRLR